LLDINKSLGLNKLLTVSISRLTETIMPEGVPVTVGIDPVGCCALTDNGIGEETTAMIPTNPIIRITIDLSLFENIIFFIVLSKKGEGR
jgi:hypothetical protein